MKVLFFSFRIMTQVFQFTTATSYYSPMNVTNTETNASLLPLETVLVAIHPPILNKNQHLLGVLIKNTAKNKKFILAPEVTLIHVLQHPFIEHNLVFVNCRHLTITREKYNRGVSSYFLLKHAFKLNNAQIQCGGISAQCLN